MSALSLTLVRPDDWHVHLRDGPALRDTVAHTARRFGRALVMPNLAPPVATAAEALAYRERILAARPVGSTFEPLMALYLTQATTPEIVADGAARGIVAAKLYPAGATTHSDAGVRDVAAMDDTFAAMSDVGMLLLVHGEVTDPAVDIFDREAAFLERVLAPIVARHPALRIVLEHITTRAAVAFVRTAPPTVAATITAHHLLLNRNDLLAGGIRPHRYCLPILKREADRRALVEAATSGSSRFFMGTDSAPHARHAKEQACGCAGIFTAHAALGLYAEAFEAAGRLGRLEGFASHFGPDFYGLPRATERVELARDPIAVPATLRLGDADVVPMRAGGEVAWRTVG